MRNGGWKFFVCTFVFLVFTLHFVSAASMKTIPDQPTWVADGTTEYIVRVFADNSGLSNPTASADWRLMNTPGFDYVTGSSATADINDFFDGFSMFWQQYNSPGSLSGRVSNGNVPVGTSGNLGVMKFTVPIGTTPGNYHFELGLDTNLGDNNGNIQYEPAIQDTYVSFEVVADADSDLHTSDVDCDDTNPAIYHFTVSGLLYTSFNWSR